MGATHEEDREWKDLKEFKRLTEELSSQAKAITEAGRMVSVAIEKLGTQKVKTGTTIANPRYWNHQRRR